MGAPNPEAPRESAPTTEGMLKKKKVKKRTVDFKMLIPCALPAFGIIIVSQMVKIGKMKQRRQVVQL